MAQPWNHPLPFILRSALWDSQARGGEPAHGLWGMSAGPVPRLSFLWVASEPQGSRVLLAGDRPLEGDVGRNTCTCLLA